MRERKVRRMGVVVNLIDSNGDKKKSEKREIS